MTAMQGGARSELRRQRLGFAALLLGAAAIGFAPILVRLSDTSPTASAFWRVALAAPVLWLWVWMAGRGSRSANGGLDDRRAHEPLHRGALLAGLFFACDLGAWHLSIAWTSVANATLEANFAPLFVTLGAWWLWGQKPKPAFLLALAMTLAGAVLLIGPNFNAGGQAFRGDMVGTLTAVFYACYMLAISSVAGRLPTARIMAISTTVSALALAPYAALTAEHFMPQTAYGWLLLAALALGPHVAGQSLIAFGFSRLPAALSSVSLLMQAVLAALFSWLLLGEGMLPVQMAGGVVVMAGIYLARRAG